MIDFLMKYGGTPSVKASKQNDEESAKPAGGDDTEPDDVAIPPKKDNKPDPLDNKNAKILEMAQIIITFNMENPDNRVEYDIWFSSTDD